MNRAKDLWPHYFRLLFSLFADEQTRPESEPRPHVHGVNYHAPFGLESHFGSARRNINGTTCIAPKVAETVKP